jgi:hypothetical protein
MRRQRRQAAPFNVSDTGNEYIGANPGAGGLHRFATERHRCGMLLERGLCRPHYAADESLVARSSFGDALEGGVDM